MSTYSFITELFTKYDKFIPDEQKIKMVKDLLEFEKEINTEKQSTQQSITDNKGRG